MKEEKIEIDAVLVYRDGKVYAERMVTSEMDCYLLTGIMQAMNDAIVEFYNTKKEGGRNMSKVRTEAKMANKRSKRCENCKLRLRCDVNMREVCEMSFVEGFEKGWRYRVKDMMKEEEV